MKITDRSLIALLLVALLWAGNAHAVPMDGLYDAVVPVPDTSEAERPAAFARALEKVLVRASGSPGVLELQGIEQILGDAGSLVQAYRYQRFGEGDAALQNLQLAVSFGAVGVNRALAQLDARVWGANRPAVLGWIATQTRAGRTLVTGDANTSWTGLINGAAQDKGIPLVLPDYDDKDRATVSLSDIWGLFMTPIEAASERYRSDLIGVARISDSSAGYTARWALKGNGIGLNGEVEGESPKAVADAVMAAWAAALAERYAVAAGDDQTLQVVDVVISAVNGLEAYAEIRQSLAAMEPVSGAAPVRILGDTLRLRVAFNGELDLLREHLALERRLSPQQEAAELDGELDGELDAGPAAGLTQDTPAKGALAAPRTANSMPAGASQVVTGPEADPAVSQKPLPDPSTQPIPGLGDPLEILGGKLLSERIKEETAEEDFTSIYPVLYFKWTGGSSRTGSTEATLPQRQPMSAGR